MGVPDRGDSTPAAREVYGFGADRESLAQGFDQYLQSLDLVIGHPRGLAVGDDANSNGLAVAVPAPAGYGGPLLSPFFGGQDLAVMAAGTVAKTEVEVCVLGI